MEAFENVADVISHAPNRMFASPDSNLERWGRVMKVEWEWEKEE